MWIESTARAVTALSLRDSERWMPSSQCVIRIRIRTLSRSTQTEVNEHDCLQWDVPLPRPAVTCLEGNCWERPPCLSVIDTHSPSEVFTSISSSLPCYPLLSLHYDTSSSSSRCRPGDISDATLKEVTSSWLTFSNVDYSPRCRASSLKDDGVCGRRRPVAPATES